jgi:hypothetical protein
MKIKTPDAVGPGSRAHTRCFCILFNRETWSRRAGGRGLFVILLLLLTLLFFSKNSSHFFSLFFYSQFDNSKDISVSRHVTIK